MKLRSVEEIVEKLKDVVKEDLFGWNISDYMEFLPFSEIKEFLFGWNISDYMEFLPFSEVKEFLVDGVTKEECMVNFTEYTLDNVLFKMRDYMDFAVSKAENERGISSNRSIDHYTNWFWLIGEDEMSAHMFDDYCDYGMSRLIEIQKWLEEYK